MNKMIIAFGLVGILGALGLGCGSSIDNYGACQDYVKTVNDLECIGGASLPESTCDGYKNSTTCDVSEYFDCVSSHYVCKDGALDTTELAKNADCKVPTCN